MFDIDTIEKFIETKTTEYIKKGESEKHNIEVNLLTQSFRYLDESIVFPFLPKKQIKRFTNKSGIFMSKQVPLLLVAEVKNQDEEDNFEGEIAAAPYSNEKVISKNLKDGESKNGQKNNKKQP